MRDTEGSHVSDPVHDPVVETQMDGFIAKFDPDMADRIRAFRAAMRRRLPTAVELVYDNYNFFVIGYGPNERASDAMLSLAAAANGVSLCLLHGATLPDPDGILTGDGKQTRFVRLSDATTLDEPAVERIIAAAVERNRVPMPTTGGGYTVVKSISAKQRPRRKG
jgi:hypothetical protein